MLTALVSVLFKPIRAGIAVFMAVASIFGGLLGFEKAEISHKSDGCLASFAVISDTHLTEANGRREVLEIGLEDMSKAKDRLDALVICGDITDHGYDTMWESFALALSKYDISDNNIMVIGNHDTWGSDDVAVTKENFIKYNKLATGREISEVYYTTEINGCPAIVLGSEGDHTYATVSDTQIEWFAQQMEAASQTGRPIFIFFHQPVNDTHGLPYTWEMNKEDEPGTGGIGDASDRILEIIKQYKNVFYISGHIHEGFSTEDDGTVYASIEKYDGYTLINVPCYMYSDFLRGGNFLNGTGYVVEVYENEVLFRARNFISGIWQPKYDTAIELTK
ncbi:MAG: metallophosphoesterase [Clostridia bacterium]|nr:metallophosphoesterase [Clostridia bacterium]